MVPDFVSVIFWRLQSGFIDAVLPSRFPLNTFVTNPRFYE